jgi:hypothetical protein
VSVTSTGSARSNARIISPCVQGVKCYLQLNCPPYVQGVIFAGMDDDQIKKLWSEFARRGGQARAKALTAKERKAIATKASKAAARARTRKAKKRKAARAPRSKLRKGTFTDST